MFLPIFFLICLMAGATFGAPQFISDQYYLTPHLYYPTSNVPNSYVVVYPQTIQIPKEGEEGGEDEGGFWQSFFSYLSKCGGGDEGDAEKFVRRTIPPPIDQISVSEKESEKHGSPNKEKVEELIPSKPFYYVLPPSTDHLQYSPQTSFIGRPNAFYPFYLQRLQSQDGQPKLMKDTSKEDKNDITK